MDDASVSTMLVFFFTPRTLLACSRPYIASSLAYISESGIIKECDCGRTCRLVLFMRR